MALTPKQRSGVHAPVSTPLHVAFGERIAGTALAAVLPLPLASAPPLGTCSTCAPAASDMIQSEALGRQLFVQGTASDDGVLGVGSCKTGQIETQCGVLDLFDNFEVALQRPCKARSLQVHGQNFILP